MAAADTPARNSALLVAPGTRARLELARGVAADVLRGAAPGPTLWLWASRGAEDPSLQQALGELRDQLDPASLRGAIGLLLDGPPPPIGRESYAFSAAAALARDAAGVVLLAGPPGGHRAAPHAAADLASARDRRLARALGLRFVTAPLFQPALNRAILSGPCAWLIAGESDRLERAIVDATREALRALLLALGIERGERDVRPTLILRSLTAVEIPAPGLVEPAISPGEHVQRGEIVAHSGAPGGARRALRTPTSGVALYLRAGHLLEGTAAVIARLPVGATVSSPPAIAPDELGWCELVDLPELGVAALPAKIDTGARTSALHVHAMRLVGGKDRRTLYDIEVPTGERGRTVRARVEAIEHALIRDSGGHAERRPVIETRLRLGGRERRVRISLTDRGDMRFPMLIGRTSLDARTRVDPTRAFVTRAARKRPR